MPTASIELARTEALAWADARFGVPVATGWSASARGGEAAPSERCRFVVFGMGKLGGNELNGGSDVDLLLFYETDDGCVVKGGAETETTLHEYFTRVSQRFTATLSDVTEDGFRLAGRSSASGRKGRAVRW